jgi:hypothetical protein
MFGYVNIDKSKLTEGERGLWQTFMCGLCFSTKKFFKNTARLTVNNDINFFNVLLHSFGDVDVEIMNSRCFAHPLKKRTIVTPTTLTDTLSIANVVLVYFNLYDDVVDGGSWKKRAAWRAFKGHYQRAKALLPELDGVVGRYYEELRTLEKANSDSIDRVCHPFSQLTKEFSRIVTGERYTETLGELAYNVGKWIYLIDALDDIKKDFSKGQYNAFISCYKAKNEAFVSENLGEITFLMYAVLNKIAMCYNDLNLNKYKCLLKNVIFDSIRDRTKGILDRYKETK